MHDSLRHVPLFRDLSDEQERWLAERSSQLVLAPGKLLFKEGDPADACYVILDGEVEITKRSHGTEVVLANHKTGVVLGEMALLVGGPRSASGKAVTETTLLRIGYDVFQELLDTGPAAAQAILRTVASRLAQTESLLRQNEKMAALGTMAAGLAHELNNPAAAAKRAADQLGEAFESLQSLLLKLSQHQWTAEQLDLMSRLQREAQAAAASPTPLDPLEQSDRESRVEAWLEEHGVREPWTLSPSLVSAGLGTGRLDDAASQFPPEALGDVLAWLAATFAVHGLQQEVGHGVARISELVGAMKQYSYLDQAPVQEVDVHEGLENTLIMLRHKLKAGVTVTREYDRSLPRITAYASELNQVWTNLIDNAVQAMNGQGRLWVRTSRDGSCILVEIADDGPGIPPEAQSRIFEPFFTTKAPGEGTGLGLHITYSIVQKHRGEIRVISKPGDTRFQVKLPIE